MRSFHEFYQANANVTGAIGSEIIKQLPPQMKEQWDRIVQDFPRLYAFLGDLNKNSKGTWKISPAEFVKLLNQHLVSAAGGINNAMTAPFVSKTM